MGKTMYRAIGNRSGYPYPIGGIFDHISEAVHCATNYARIEANKNANCAVHRIDASDSAAVNCAYPFASCVFKAINEFTKSILFEIFVYPIDEKDGIYKYRGIEIRSNNLLQRFDIYIMGCFICFTTTINEALMFIDSYRNTRLSC